LFAKLQPAIDDGRIRNLETNPPQLAWGNNKLYVSVDWLEDGVTARRTLIYDPTLGEGGAWVATDIDVGPLYAYNPPNTTSTVYGGCVTNTGILVDVEDAQNRTSDRYVGSTEAHIASYFVTRWVTGRDPIVKKRWGRPRVVLSAESTITLPILIYKDFDKSEQSNAFELSVTGKVSQSRWGTAKWDDADPESAYVAEWDAISSSLTANVQNLPTLGTGRSISMKVSGPSTNNHWEVNALAFTYTPRRLR
jgi:hypothetical protein